MQLPNTFEEQDALCKQLKLELHSMKHDYSVYLQGQPLLSAQGAATAVFHLFGCKTPGEKRKSEFTSKLKDPQATLRTILQACYDTLHSTSIAFAKRILPILETRFKISMEDYANYFSEHAPSDLQVPSPTHSRTSATPSADPAPTQPDNTAASASTKTDEKTENKTTPPLTAVKPPKTYYSNPLTRLSSIKASDAELYVELSKKAMLHILMNVLMPQVLDAPRSPRAAASLSTMESPSESSTTAALAPAAQSMRKGGRR